MKSNKILSKWDDWGSGGWFVSSDGFIEMLYLDPGSKQPRS